MENFLQEEINLYESEESGSDGEERNIENELDRQILVSKGYEIPISEGDAKNLYELAGSEQPEETNEVFILPSPHLLNTWEEQMISRAKHHLSVPYDLDKFQVQALVALLNGRNVILIAPCGSGKLLVFYMAVHLLRIKFNKPNGVGLCLQPLNNILLEKTNGDPPIKTAYLTMTGDCVKSGNTKLSHPVDEIRSGEIGCLLGHAESFLSTQGSVIISNTRLAHWSQRAFTMLRQIMGSEI